MELSLLNIKGTKSSSKVNLPDGIFKNEFNEPLVHQVITAYLSNARSGTKASLTRAEVSGGGAKPWRQKGTGRARAGTTRGPIWRGGGVTFAASPRDHSQKVNRKMYRAAMLSILSELVRQERFYVVDDIKVQQPKTKELASILKNLKLDEVMIVIDKIDEPLYLASRNLPRVTVRHVSNLDPVSLVRYKNVLFTESAVAKLEEVFV